MPPHSVRIRSAQRAARLSAQVMLRVSAFPSSPIAMTLCIAALNATHTTPFAARRAPCTAS